VKRLLDENLSDRIVPQIADLYPGSTHVKTLALIQTEDVLIWEYAKANDFAIASKDFISINVVFSTVIRQNSSTFALAIVQPLESYKSCGTISTSSVSLETVKRKVFWC
jgi:hypothetical protein